MAKEVIYSDIDISFRAHPVTGNLIMRRNKDAIAQSLKNLILLDRFEDLVNPDIYTDINYSLFELVDDVKLTFIKESIQNTITNYEGRVTLLDVRYRVPADNPNGVIFTIYYMPQNAIEAETVDVFLERVR